MSTMFTSNWSFSKLMMYEACPMRVKLKYIERLPEPPLPPENPLERGSRIHNRIEDYIVGKTSVYQEPEAKKIEVFVPVIGHLRTLHGTGQATAEQDIFFDENWNLTNRKNVWLWLKKDYNVKDNANLRVITGDWKSGKSGYKTMEHIQQTQLYVACDALQFEWAETFDAELGYVDEGWIRRATYQREEALKFIGRFDARADRLYNDKFFRPNANKITCRYCPFSPRGTGACPVGV